MSFDRTLEMANLTQTKNNTSQLADITHDYNKTLKLTQAEYDAIVTKDATTLYLIKEA